MTERDLHRHQRQAAERTEKTHDSGNEEFNLVPVRMT